MFFVFHLLFLLRDAVCPQTTGPTLDVNQYVTPCWSSAQVTTACNSCQHTFFSFMVWEPQVLKQPRLWPTVYSEITPKKYCSVIKFTCYRLLSSRKVLFNWIKVSRVSCWCCCSQHKERVLFSYICHYLQMCIVGEPFIFPSSWIPSNGFLLLRRKARLGRIAEFPLCWAPCFGICFSFWAVSSHWFLVL